MAVNKLLFHLKFSMGLKGKLFKVKFDLKYYWCVVTLFYLCVTDDEEGDDDENFDGDEDKDEDQNLAVYDFDEGEEGASGDGQDSEDEDIKPRMSKGGMKKVTQTVSQAHMCNYCNYTSPKR